MRIPVIYLIFGLSLLSAIPVAIHAHRSGRRSPSFDFLIATFLPGLGLLMYVSSVRMGLTPPPVQPIEERARTIARESRERKTEADEPESLMAGLTAEVRRLRVELEQTKAELAVARDERATRHE